MSSLPFRSHDQIPSDVTSAVLRGLVAEWVSLNALPSTVTTLRGWATLEPVLAGHERAGELLDAIDAAGPAGSDALLLALIRLTQHGHQLAGRIVLHAMLPKLSRMVFAVGGASTDDARVEDRRQIALAELWHVIANYRVERRPQRVAANLALDTLHRLTAPARTPDPALLTDPHEMPDGLVAGPEDLVFAEALNPDADLIELLTWARTNGLISGEDADLLRLVYATHDDPAGPRSDAAARQLGLTPAAVRQRCARTRRRLSAAIDADRAARSRAL